MPIHHCENGFLLLSFREARGPCRDSCRNGDRSQQADRAGRASTNHKKNFRLAAKFQPGDNISPGVYNPAKKEPVMKALHTLGTTTLLTNTMLLISSGKYHSYFGLSPLSLKKQLGDPPTPAPSGGMDGACIPTHLWKSCSGWSSPQKNPKGLLINR